MPLRSFIDHAESIEDPARLAWGAVAGAYLGDEETTRRLYDRAIGRARDTGHVTLLPFLLEQRAMAEWSAGQTGFAEGDATESMRLTEELGRVRPALLAMATLTDATARRGRVEEARELGARTVAAAEQYGVGLAVDLVEAGLMELDLAQGRVDAALERALRLDGTQRETHPMVTILTTPTRVEVLGRADRPVPAEEMERFRQWTLVSPGPGYPPLLARCEALLAARYRPLRAGAAAPAERPPGGGAAVELLLTARDGWDEDGIELDPAIDASTPLNCLAEARAGYLWISVCIMRRFKLRARYPKGVDF